MVLLSFSAIFKFLGIREKIIVDGEETYRNFCYVTNDNLTPWKAHKKYGKRAASENWIEWCKGQMASGSILTNQFWANDAIFQTYNKIKALFTSPPQVIVLSIQ